MKQRDEEYQSIFQIEGMILRAAVRLLKPRMVFESGTNNGYATGWLTQGLEDAGGDAMLHTCEVREEAGAAWRKNVPEEAQKRVAAHWMSSISFLEDNPGPYDFAFLDGGHDTIVVAEELRLLGVRVDGGPIVFLHDARPGSRIIKGIERYVRSPEGTGQGVAFYAISGTSLATNLDPGRLEMVLKALEAGA